MSRTSQTINPGCYSDRAIKLVLTLRLVFQFALHQTTEFIQNSLALLGLELRVPDNTTLSRQSRIFGGRQPRVSTGGDLVHLMLDSTRLEFSAKVNGMRPGMAVLTGDGSISIGEISTHVLTKGHANGAAQVPDLLRQPKNATVSIIADGACDRDAIYQTSSGLKRFRSLSGNTLLPTRTGSAARLQIAGSKIVRVFRANLGVSSFA